MKTSEHYFGKQAYEYTETGGFEQKARLLQCVSDGNIAAIEEELQVYLGHLKTMVGDDMAFTKDALLFVWAQLSFAASREGMSDNQTRDIQQKYYYELERANSADKMLSLCRAQVIEFTEGVHQIKMESSYSQVVKKCCDYVRANIYEKPTVESVAEALHFSRSYISHRFREETGKTLNSYIQSEKVAEAKLLLSTHVPLSDIAEKLGYSSQSHFTDIFKRETGMTPNQFRKRKR